MVRASRNASNARAAAAWRASQAPDAWDRAMAMAPGHDPEHDPDRTTHHHYHLHDPDEGVAGLDADGGHSHMHSHGKQADALAPVEPDNSHVHPGDHDQVDQPPGETAEPEYERPEWAESRYRKHIRFERGGVQVVNMLRDRDQRARGAAVAGPRGQMRPWSPYAALYRRDAPGARLVGKVGSVGEMVAALRNPATRADMARLLNSGLTTRIPAEGGFTVAEELRSELMLTAVELGIIRKRALVIPDAGEFRVNIPVLEEQTEASTIMGGLELYWTAEGAALTSTVPSFGRVTLQAKKLAGELLTPNELFRDADQLDTFLHQSIPAAVAFYEDQAFIAGDSTTSAAGSQPQGLLNAPCAVTVTRQTSDSVTVQDVYSMTKRMLARSMNNFIWLGSPDVTSQLLDLYVNFGSATSGISPPPDWLRFDAAQGCWTLLGRPYYSTGHVSALGTEGDLVAVDPAFYVIADRMELTIDVAAESNAGFLEDETVVRVRERLDGRIWLQQAVVPANSSETTSPVVILD